MKLYDLTENVDDLFANKQYMSTEETMIQLNHKINAIKKNVILVMAQCKEAKHKKPYDSFKVNQLQAQEIKIKELYKFLREQRIKIRKSNLMTIA